MNTLFRIILNYYHLLFIINILVYLSKQLKQRVMENKGIFALKVALTMLNLITGILNYIIKNRGGMAISWGTFGFILCSVLEDIFKD